MLDIPGKSGAGILEEGRCQWIDSALFESWKDGALVVMLNP